MGARSHRPSLREEEREEVSDYELLDHTTIHHKDGTPWYEAPAPSRHGHQHEAQTMSNRIDRCACGATRFFDDPVWIDEPTGPRWADEPNEPKPWWRFW